jgi:hypothetical protein
VREYNQGDMQTAAYSIAKARYVARASAWWFDFDEIIEKLLSVIKIDDLAVMWSAGNAWEQHGTWSSLLGLALGPGGTLRESAS